MKADELVDALARQGIRTGVGVPCSYFTPLVNHMVSSPQCDYIGATSEGEAVAVAAGLIAAGRPAFALMQNSGLGNAVNPITSLLQIYGIPVVLLVSHRGQPGTVDEPQHRLMGQITGDICRLCGLKTFLFDTTAFEDNLAGITSGNQPGAFIFEGGVLKPSAAPHPSTPQPHHPTRPPVLQSPHDPIPSMSRERALQIVLDRIDSQPGSLPATPAVISSTGKISRELFEYDKARGGMFPGHFAMVGSMGCAAGFGLGVARACPSRRVVVIDGDGALLMKLGTLATIGWLAPENFLHITLDNGVHDSTGGQPTASPFTDLSLIALASGYRTAETVSSPQTLDAGMEHLFSRPGPSFLRVLVRPGSRSDLGRPDIEPAAVYRRFSQFLQQIES